MESQNAAPYIFIGRLKMKLQEQYNLVEILDFLKNYSNMPYKNPQNEANIDEKNKLQDIKNKGQNTLSIFKDMCLSFYSKIYWRYERS